MPGTRVGLWILKQKEHIWALKGFSVYSNTFFSHGGGGGYTNKLKMISPK